MSSNALAVRVLSSSAAVTRTLEAILIAAGHHISDAAEALTLIDAAHPIAPEQTATAKLRLQGAGSTLDIPCPLRPAQLLQKLQALRSHAPLPMAHGWALDGVGRSLTHPTLPPLVLTEKEASLLAALAKAAPQALEREALLAQVWGMGEGVDTHTLETHIYRLRHKLAERTPAPCELVTVAGAYKLALPE